MPSTLLTKKTPQKKPKLNVKGQGKDLIEVKAGEAKDGMYDSDGTVGGSNVVDHADDYALESLAKGFGGGIRKIEETQREPK